MIEQDPRVQVLPPDLPTQMGIDDPGGIHDNGSMVDELRHKAEEHITLFSCKVDDLIARHHMSPQMIEGMLRNNNIPGYLVAVPVWAIQKEMEKEHQGIKISSRLPYDPEKKFPFVTLYFVEKQLAEDILGQMRVTPEQNFQMLGRAGLRLITLANQ